MSQLVNENGKIALDEKRKIPKKSENKKNNGAGFFKSDFQI